MADKKTKNEASERSAFAFDQPTEISYFAWKKGEIARQFEEPRMNRAAAATRQTA